MNPRNFLAELKRRNGYKVAVAYAVVARSRGYSFKSPRRFSLLRNSEVGGRHARSQIAPHFLLSLRTEKDKLSTRPNLEESRNAHVHSKDRTRGPRKRIGQTICRLRVIPPHVHATAIRRSSLPRSFDQRLGQIPERAAHRRRGGGHNRFHRNAHARGARAHTR